MTAARTIAEIPSTGRPSVEDKDVRASALGIEEVDFREPEWLAFISAHPDALIYHHPDFLAGMEREYGQKCLALGCVQEGKLQGLLPLFYTRGLPRWVARNDVGRRLSSLPRTPVTGPLFTSSEAAESLLNAAVNLVRCQPGVRLEIKTMISGLDALVPGLHCIPWRDTYVRGLPTNEEEDPAVPENLRSELPCITCDGCGRLRFGNAREMHQVSWGVKQARKHGLKTQFAQTQAELRAWYELYLEGMRRNVVPPRPFRFFQELWNRLQPSGNLLLVLVEHHGSERVRMVAGSILLLFGSTAFWGFTGTRESDFSLHPNDIMLWDALQECCRRGYSSFDFGEVAEEHPELRQFKTKWGTMLQPIYRYYYPKPEPSGSRVTSRTHGVLRRAWQRLPLPAVAALGDLAYLFL